MKSIQAFALMTNNGRHKRVDQIINWLSEDGTIEQIKKNLHPENWVFYNCLYYGFRKKVIPWRGISITQFSKYYHPNYYNCREPMTNKEIFHLLNRTRIRYRFSRYGLCILDGNHRIYAMIGRIIRGENYIPFTH